MASSWLGCDYRLVVTVMNYKSDSPCVACKESRENMVCYHHLNTRKSGGTDDYWNLMPLCLKCHNEIHAKGLIAMTLKHLGVKNWLSANGWKLCHFRGKYVHE